MCQNDFQGIKWQVAAMYPVAGRNKARVEVYALVGYLKNASRAGEKKELQVYLPLPTLFPIANHHQNGLRHGK
jgi:hypothetical protein